MKVLHASYHLDDDILVWFQDCEHDLNFWDDFVRTIQLRFGPTSYDDPVELLTKLKHINSVEYIDQFESLSNRIRNLSDMHKLSCFMSGLKDEVRLAIKMQGPRTLGEAYALAKIQEEYLATVKRSTRLSYKANKSNWGQSSSQQAAARSDHGFLTLNSLVQGLEWLCKSSLQCKCQREERKTYATIVMRNGVWGTSASP